MEAPMSDTPPPILSIISPAARQLLDGLTALDTAVIAAARDSFLTTFHFGPRDPSALASLASMIIDEAELAFHNSPPGGDDELIALRRRVIAARVALDGHGVDCDLGGAAESFDASPAP
jgi:hypothetical protein